jgi:hypothetical protein
LGGCLGQLTIHSIAILANGETREYADRDPGSISPLRGATVRDDAYGVI